MKTRAEVARHLGDFESSPAGFQIEDGDVKVVDHVQALNQMVKVIALVPMEDYLKGILLTRLTNPGIGLFELSERYGVRYQKVLELEEEAKLKVKDYLKQHDIKTIVEKYNHSESSTTDAKVRNELKNPFGGESEN